MASSPNHNSNPSEQSIYTETAKEMEDEFYRLFLGAARNDFPLPDDTIPLAHSGAQQQSPPPPSVPGDVAPLGPLAAQAEPQDTPSNVAPAPPAAAPHEFPLLVQNEIPSWEKLTLEKPPFETVDPRWLTLNPLHEVEDPFAGHVPALAPEVHQAAAQQQHFPALAPAVHVPPPQQQQQQQRALIAQGVARHEPGRSDGAEGERGQDRNDHRERNGRPRRGRPRKGEARPPKPPKVYKRPRKDRDGAGSGSAGGAAGGTVAF